MKKDFKNKTIALLLSCAMVLSAIPTTVFAESTNISSTGSAETDFGDSPTTTDGKDVTQGESPETPKVSETEIKDNSNGDGASAVNVYATIASTYTVYIPKTIVIDAHSKEGHYKIEAKGDIAGDERLTITPQSSFTLTSGEGKGTAEAVVTQQTKSWLYDDLYNDGIEQTGVIQAEDIEAGTWHGTFNFDIAIDYGEAFAVYSSNDNSLKFYSGIAPEDSFEENGSVVEKVYSDIENTNYESAADTPWYEYADEITNVEVVDKISPTNLDYWFCDFTEVSTMSLNNLDTSNTTSMEKTFYNAGKNANTLEFVNANNFDESEDANESGRNQYGFYFDKEYKHNFDGSVMSYVFSENDDEEGSGTVTAYMDGEFLADVKCVYGENSITLDGSDDAMVVTSDGRMIMSASDLGDEWGMDHEENMEAIKKNEYGFYYNRAYGVAKEWGAAGNKHMSYYEYVFYEDKSLMIYKDGVFEVGYADLVYSEKSINKDTEISITVSDDGKSLVVENTNMANECGKTPVLNEINKYGFYYEKIYSDSENALVFHSDGSADLYESETLKLVQSYDMNTFTYSNNLIVDTTGTYGNISVSGNGEILNVNGKEMILMETGNAASIAEPMAFAEQTSNNALNWDTSNVQNMSYTFANSNIETLDLSSWNTTSVTTMTGMFDGMNKLKEITIGVDFAWVGTDGYLPVQSDTYITGADGKWYDKETKIGYEPSLIPQNAFATYTAVVQS